jgi:hypothetical protein
MKKTTPNKKEILLNGPRILGMKLNPVVKISEVTDKTRKKREIKNPRMKALKTQAVFLEDKEDRMDI